MEEVALVKSIVRFLSLPLALTIMLGSASARAAEPAPTPLVGDASVVPGHAVTLQAIPSFTTRLFLPVVPVTTNLLRIDNLPLTEVVEVPAGFSATVADGALLVTAPHGDAAGYAKVRGGTRELTITLLNTVPYEEIRNGVLRGYRIGSYMEKPLRGLASYRRPAGFIQLTRENSELWVSDRYRLRDFQCKLDGPAKFLVVRPEALLKLELMQEAIEREQGIDFTRFTIMSGYRTPYYNSRIGNETSYSRHLYGDAMDIYVDENGDSSMDDINRDGRVDRHDAIFLLAYAERIDDSREWSWLKGGAGVYNANHAHGPYLHIDTRGYVARWGI